MFKITNVTNSEKLQRVDRDQECLEQPTETKAEGTMRQPCSRTCPPPQKKANREDQENQVVYKCKIVGWLEHKRSD